MKMPNLASLYQSGIWYFFSESQSSLKGPAWMTNSTSASFLSTFAFSAADSQGAPMTMLLVIVIIPTTTTKIHLCHVFIFSFGAGTEYVYFRSTQKAKQMLISKLFS